jgi:hypothetical protein
MKKPVSAGDTYTHSETALARLARCFWAIADDRLNPTASCSSECKAIESTFLDKESMSKHA